MVWDLFQHLFQSLFWNKNLLWDKKRILSSINCCQVLQSFSYWKLEHSKRVSPLVTEVTFCSTRGQTYKVPAKGRALRPCLLSSCSPLKCWHAGMNHIPAFEIPWPAAPCNRVSPSNRPGLFQYQQQWWQPRNKAATILYWNESWTENVIKLKNTSHSPSSFHSV